MSIRVVISYFFPYQRPITRFHRHIARNVENVNATQDEIILIERGLARNKHEARRLMLKHDANHALDVIEALHRKSKSTFMGRLQTLFMRIEGTSHRNPDDMRSAAGKNIMPYSVSFKERFHDEKSG